MHDCNIRLRGYLSTGKFIVNDYTIEIEKTDDGVLLTITGGNGELQQALIRNGEDGNLDEINAKLAEMLDRQTAYAAAEELRAAADAAREAAEAERAAAEAARAEEFQDFLDQVDEDLAATEAAKEAAAAAAAEAAQKAQEAADAATGGLYDMLFYKNGDVIEFVEGEDETVDAATVDKAYSVKMSTESLAGGLCSFGYVTNSKKLIYGSIPLGKSLHYIDGVTCERLTCHIANGGGYGIKSAASSTGEDYLPVLKNITINKVKNTLDLTIERSTAFNLTNNAPVSLRVKGVGLKFVLHAGGADD